MERWYRCIALWLVWSVSAAAQGVRGGPTVSTGHVLDVDPDTGQLLIYSLEIRRPILFQGVTRARVETSSGRPVSWDAVMPEMPITVYYAPRGGQWQVEKVAIPEIPPAPVLRPDVLTGPEQRALQSKAFNDGDITTNPGNRARIDDDITTNPAKKDPYVWDITRRVNNP